MSRLTVLLGGLVVAAGLLSGCSHNKPPVATPSPLPVSSPASSPMASPITATEKSKIDAEVDASLKAVDEGMTKSNTDDFNPTTLQDL